MLTKFNANTAGGAGLASIGAVIQELRGLTTSIGAGAAAGTKVNVAGIRVEDHLQSVVRSVAGVFTDVTANYSIVDTHATGTLTAAAVAEGDTAVINGVTYTARAVPAKATDFKFTVGDNTATAAALAKAVNTAQVAYNGTSQGKAAVKATSAAAIVTITAVVDEVAGNAITLVGTAGRLAASAATLTGGSATGGVKSDTDHSATSSLLIHWYNKQ